MTGADGGPARVGITYEEGLEALQSQQDEDEGEGGTEVGEGAVPPGAMGL